MKILVLPPVDAAQKMRLESAAPGAEFHYIDPERVAESDVCDADAIVGNVSPGLLSSARKLKLLQLNSAGYDKYSAPGTVPSATALCCATGAYGQAVSEHLFAMLLAAMKRLPEYRDCQRAHDWRDLGPVTSLVGAQVLVLGAGDIGTHLARLFSAMGAHVQGVRAHSAPAHEPFEGMGTLSDLPELLPRADVVASVLPSTPETKGLADAAFFNAMKRGAYFANAGRGDLVVQADLRTALLDGNISAAVLDVTDPEPLPADDPLWDTPGAFITPHISGFYHLPVTLDNIVDIAAENLSHLVRGEAFRNHVNR